MRALAANIFDRINGIKQLEEDVTGDPNGYIGKNSRAICDGYQTDPGNPAFNGPGGGALRGSLDRMCKPYYDELGEPPVEPVPPFEGGQCSINYRVRRLLDEATGTGTAPQLEIFGPIVSISFSPSSLPAMAPPTAVTLTVVNEAGQSVSASATATGGVDGVTFEPQIFPLNGLPDNCGDPPPVYKPNPGYPTPRPWGAPTVPGTDPSGDPYTYTPRTDPATGTPWIEIDGPEGPVGLPPFGGDPPDMTEPSGPPSLGPPVDVDGAGEVEADPEDEVTEGELIGYQVTVRDSAPQFQSVIPGTEPRVYAMVVGSVQLKLEGSGAVFYSDNLRLTSKEASIIKQHPSLVVKGLSYNVLPSLEGLTIREIRGRDDDS